MNKMMMGVVALVMGLTTAIGLAWAVSYPSSLMDVVAPYPKAKIIANVESAEGANCVLSSSDAPATVADYYNAALTAKGWKPEVKTEMENMHMAVYAKGNQKINVVIASETHDGVPQKDTSVTLNLVTETENESGGE